MAPRVITVVPVRMASTRLPGKAMRLLHGVPLIERCVLNTLAIPSSTRTVIATTASVDDDPLCEIDIDGAVDTVRGSADDVLERMLSAIDRHEPEYVVRITGDCPAASFELAEFLIQHHVRSGADISYPGPGFPVGINSEVYTASALRKLRALSPETPLSEYLIFYFTQNPDIFKVSQVPIPPEYAGPWRLTVDEPSDIELFELIFSSIGAERRAVAFGEIAAFFERRPEAASINGRNQIKYVHDETFLSRLRAATRIETPAE